jgi:C4-dicarboxylate-specific signal transduction histidine kinase
MASIGTLTAGVAHEINNPLNFINGGLELISEFYHKNTESMSDGDNELFTESMKIISSGIDRASSIVKSLMTFSYRGKPKLVYYKLTEIIDNTLLFLQSKLADIKVEKDYQFEGEQLLYPDKLHQVVLNLLDNAIFALKNSDQQTPIIKISTQKSENSVYIQIADNGPGIPENNLSKIFDPFFTTKDPGEGTGLGLSISYSLVFEQGGTLTAKNTNPGCMFVIQFSNSNKN